LTLERFVTTAKADFADWIKTHPLEEIVIRIRGKNTPSYAAEFLAISGSISARARFEICVWRKSDDEVMVHGLTFCGNEIADSSRVAPTTSDAVAFYSSALSDPDDGLQNGRVGTMLRAAKELCALKDSRCVTPLICALDATLRAMALTGGLRTLPGESYAGEKLDRLFEALVEALAAIGTDEALGRVALLLPVHDDTGHWVSRVARALGDTRDPKWSETLKFAVARERFAGYSLCMLAIAEIGGADEIPYFVEALGAGKVDAALDALLSIAKDAPDPVRKRVVDPIRNLLKHEAWDDHTRWSMYHGDLEHAIDALVTLDDPGAFAEVLGVASASWDTTDIFKYVISPKILKTIPVLERWLERDGELIPTEDLDRVISLKAQYRVKVEWHDDGASYTERTIDCAVLQQMAMAELARRGAATAAG
jgi:hypothetical protein